MNNNKSLCFYRYTYSKEKFYAAQIQEGMRLHNMYEGTDLEREIRADFFKELDPKDV